MHRSRSIRAVFATLSLLAGLSVAAAARGAEVGWLYDVTVPVADQSSRARLEAAGRALEVVLGRLSGLAEVPRNEAVNRALAAPDLYYNQFRFEQDEDNQLQLRLQFAPAPILELVRDAELPIWRTNRALVVAWIAVDDGESRRILGADSDDPEAAALLEALRERARERGLPLRLPLLDLTDQLAVEPAAVWGRLGAALEPASERYGADVLLVGRVQQQADGRAGQRFSGDWELWIEDEVAQAGVDDADAEALGRLAADLAANELAARYAVEDRGTQQLDLAVQAVNDAADYGNLLRYVSSLEFVQEVVVSFAAADQLGISLVTSASPEQLLQLFELDQRLLPAEDAMPGSPIELVWQRP